ncbi:MAG: polysulfide reductase NrfD [Planctomycetaceae bacterium]|jgi:Ni/Fe-hydrogenase subunit HybB-like protein|nr:polysulfide reductase NrfD [Planctomycetaceae bacterium]
MSNITETHTETQHKPLWSLTLENIFSVKIGFDQWSFRITPARMLLIFLALAAAGIIAVRLIFGLQAVSNLNDDWPWGLWIGFDVLSGVALAGGGYGTALIIHILHNKKLHSVSRATMLTSLIGYVLVVAGLFIEIGRWWNFWVPFVSWGHDSVLFEVFWCISMYTVVQVLEICEIITEKVFKIFHKLFVFVLPFLLILGVTLPTLHQSSLGALYLMMDGRLHPLWFSPIIFVFFFLSSFFVGPAMIAVESALAYLCYKHVTPLPVMKTLARIGGAAMILYLTLKIGDLAYHGELPLLWAGDFESLIFIAEIGIGIILPLLIVFSPLVNFRGWLILYGFLTSFGVLFNRLNVVITGMVRDTGSVYCPALTEVTVSIGLVAGGILAYMFLCENFNILGDEH